VARCAVFASGSGSNFEAIATALSGTPHSLEFLLCNKKSAFAVTRAEKLGIPTIHVSYLDRPREDAEQEILSACLNHQVELIALAGFMKLLTPSFLSRFQGTILNIHPSLLPRHAGVDALRRSFEAGDDELGISIIQVDEGCDTGPIVFQTSFKRSPGDTLESVAERIHQLEHEHYPRVVREALNRIDQQGTSKKEA